MMHCLPGSRKHGLAGNSPNRKDDANALNIFGGSAIRSSEAPALTHSRCGSNDWEIAPAPEIDVDADIQTDQLGKSMHLLGWSTHQRWMLLRPRPLYNTAACMLSRSVEGRIPKSHGFAT